MSDLLPPNAGTFERALHAVLWRTTAISVPIETVKRPEQTDERLLPVLGWEFSVNEWNDRWPVETKRAVVAAAPDVHRRLGTAGAMRRAIAATGYNVTFEEWFDYAGDPYHFRLGVNLDEQTLTLDDMNSLQRVALNTKNVRSQFEGFSATRTLAGVIRTGVGLGGLVERVFQPPEPPVYEIAVYVFTGIGQMPMHIARIFQPFEEPA